MRLKVPLCAGVVVSMLLCGCAEVPERVTNELQSNQVHYSGQKDTSVPEQPSVENVDSDVDDNYTASFEDSLSTHLIAEQWWNNAITAEAQHRVRTADMTFKDATILEKHMKSCLQLVEDDATKYALATVIYEYFDTDVDSFNYETFYPMVTELTESYEITVDGETVTIYVAMNPDNEEDVIAFIETPDEGDYVEED